MTFNNEETKHRLKKKIEDLLALKPNASLTLIEYLHRKIFIEVDCLKSNTEEENIGFSEAWKLVNGIANPHITRLYELVDDNANSSPRKVEVLNELQQRAKKIHSIIFGNDSTPMASSIRNQITLIKEILKSISYSEPKKLLNVYDDLHELIYDKIEDSSSEYNFREAWHRIDTEGSEAAERLGKDPGNMIQFSNLLDSMNNTISDLQDAA